MITDDKHEILRRLQYRLRRQGMLELDVWLSPLQDALAFSDEHLLASVERLLMSEVPDLVAMQSGKKNIPQELKPWLNI